MTLIIGAGGFLGTILRYFAASAAVGFSGRPLAGTLLVNILGSFAIGLVYAFGADKWDDQTIKVLTIGVLGGFTTYSAFSAETFFLLKDSQWLMAFGYVLLMTVSCLGATSLGFLIGR